MAEQVRPLTDFLKIIDDLAADGEKIQLLLDQGFGDKAFRRAVKQFQGKCTRVRSTVQLLMSRSTEVEPEEKGGSETTPNDDGVYIIDDATGDSRLATDAELKDLAARGAPVGSGRSDIDMGDDDFGGDEDTII